MGFDILGNIGKMMDIQQEGNQLSLLLTLTRHCHEFKITPAEAVNTFKEVGDELGKQSKKGK